MRLDIVPYETEHIDAVKAFNRRLTAGGSPWRFPESPRAPWLPRACEAPAWQELFVALEDREVRGAYMVKPQHFALAGDRAEIAAFQLPVSEGIVDPRFAFVGPRLLRHALRHHPLLFGLGIGSLDAPLAKLYRVSHFQFATCPFFFRVLHPNRFLKEISVLRTSPWRGRWLDLLAASGAGWLALKSLDAVKRSRSHGRGHALVTEVTAFDDEVDTVWQAARSEYNLIAERTSKALNVLFPPGDDRFVRLQVRDEGPVGWAVVADTRMTAHQQLGDMRVGSIIDQLARPGHEQAVVAAAEHLLADRGVDIIVSNQLGERWRHAFARQGFLGGPSNFFLAVSAPLAQRLGSLASVAGTIHMTRGDGDGPVHLVPGFALTDPERYERESSSVAT